MKRIEFTDEELQALANIMDAGVKSLGLTSVVAAAIILQKIQKAEEIEDDSDS